MKFDAKQDVREYVWERLSEVGVARFPFPPTGRIPNFSGAEQAARRLSEQEVFQGAEIIKINPDSPQRPVREVALRRGKTVLVPTPRLRGGFLIFDPETIDDSDIRDATMISRWEPFARTLALDEVPKVDLIVTGCVAVTGEGKRAGKGHGYSDLEYAILRELGYPPAPVVTTVHDEQVVDDFPVEAHDLALSMVVTPTEVFEVKKEVAGPDGIDWSLLSDEDLEAMPVLRQVKNRSSDASEQ